MKLRRVVRQAGGQVSIPVIAFMALVLGVAGCSGDGDSGKIEYSQKFDTPEGVKTNPPPDPNQPILSRADRRHKEIEESREENRKRPTKGKRGRP